MRRQVWEDLGPRVGDGALAPSILVSVGAVRRGWRVVEVPVRHRRRSGTGPSTLRRARLVAFSLRGLGELLRVPRWSGPPAAATMSR